MAPSPTDFGLASEMTAVWNQGRPKSARWPRYSGPGTTIGPGVDVNMLISCVVGTRPEVVKMAPVIGRLRRDGQEDVRILATGQHRSLLDQALRDFGLTADDDLDLMRPDQKLAELSARAFERTLHAF